jgi:outer membrane biosynthesis protein TonB
MVAVEELADFDDVIGTGQSKKTSPKKAAGNTDKKVPKAKTDAKKKSPVKDKPEPKAKSEQPKEPEKSEPKVEPEEKTASTQPNMSEAQKRAIYNLSRRRGISVEELEKMATDAYQCELENLNSKDASTFIRNLQQAA